VDILRHSA
jgi:hypothetical protein